jgi:peptide/nickel transport system ATP-binding protein
MYRGRIVEIAPSERLISNPCHPYTIRLLSAVPEMTGRKASKEERADEAMDSNGEAEADSRCRYYGHCPERSERCGIEGPEWYSPEKGHFVLCARQAAG